MPMGTWILGENECHQIDAIMAIDNIIDTDKIEASAHHFWRAMDACLSYRPLRGPVPHANCREALFVERSATRCT